MSKQFKDKDIEASVVEWLRSQTSDQASTSSESSIPGAKKS